MTIGVPIDVTRSLDGVLEPSEAVLGAVTSLAGSLVLTDRRIVIVREGRGFRPRSGIRSWPMAPDLVFRYVAPHGGMGRLVIGNGNRATSFFVKASDWTEALRLVSMAHGMAHRLAAGTP